DSNDWYCEYLRCGDRRRNLTFSDYAADRLAFLDADLYGFSTICNSYPVTVQIAEQLKRLRPGSVVLFGGPQASVVDVTSLRHFPFVDFILRGEADCSLPAFVS